MFKLLRQFRVSCQASLSIATTPDCDAPVDLPAHSDGAMHVPVGQQHGSPDSDTGPRPILPDARIEPRHLEGTAVSEEQRYQFSAEIRQRIDWLGTATAGTSEIQLEGARKFGRVMLSEAFGQDRDHRSHCWRCRASISSLQSERCPSCTWVICRSCGACDRYCSARMAARTR